MTNGYVFEVPKGSFVTHQVQVKTTTFLYRFTVAPDTQFPELGDIYSVEGEKLTVTSLHEAQLWLTSDSQLTLPSTGTLTRDTGEGAEDIAYTALATASIFDLTHFEYQITLKRNTETIYEQDDPAYMDYMAGKIALVLDEVDTRNFEVGEGELVLTLFDPAGNPFEFAPEKFLVVESNVIS